jgi:hypothetical protein
VQISVYAALEVSSKIDGRSLGRSTCLAVAGDLALHLFPEFQRMLDFFEYFGSAAGAAHDYRSVAQDSSYGGLIDYDALNPREEDFGGSPLSQAGLDDDSLVGDGHLRDIALEQTKTKESCSDEEADESRNVNNTVRRHRFGFGSDRPGERCDEQYNGEQLENCGDSNVPQHHNPMQLGLIPDGFTWNEMLFDVAQGGSLEESRLKSSSYGSRRRSFPEYAPRNELHQ